MPGLAQAPFASLGGRSLDNRRIAAALIDAAVVGLIVLLLRTLTGGLGGATLVLAVAWALYYFFAFEWGAEGQTIGKRLMGLRVVRDNGKEAGVREVAIRTVLRVVDGIGFYVVGLATMMATGERRQRIGDLVAGTMVTTADLGSPAPAQEPPPEPDPQPEAEPTLPPPVQPLPYERETPAEPELPPAATVEIPEPPIADEPQAPPPPPPSPPLAEPDLEPPLPEPQPMARPDVPVPPPPPPPAEPSAPPADEPQVRTDGIEIASEIDLVMQDEDDEQPPGAPGSTPS